MKRRSGATPTPPPALRYLSCRCRPHLGHMVAQRRRLSGAEEKPFGASVARILESQRAAQAICNPQCKQIEDHFKYSHSHVIAREMEADLSSCFSAILPSTGQPGSLNNDPRDKPPSKRTSVCFQGFIDIQCLLQLFLPPWKSVWK